MTILCPIVIWLVFVMLGFAARMARIDTLKRAAMPERLSPVLTTYTVPRAVGVGVCTAARDGLGLARGDACPTLVTGAVVEVAGADELAPAGPPPQPATEITSAAITTTALRRFKKPLSRTELQRGTQWPEQPMRRSTGRLTSEAPPAAEPVGHGDRANPRRGDGRGIALSSRRS